MSGQALDAPELLRQIYFINKFAKMFQCPHGLELLQNTANFAGGHIMFQCPHGLELLLNDFLQNPDGVAVSMPSWA